MRWRRLGLLGGGGGVGGLEGGLFLDLGLGCGRVLRRVWGMGGSCEGMVVVSVVMLGSEVGGRLLGLKRWRFLLAFVVGVGWEEMRTAVAVTAAVRSSKRCRWALMRCRRFVGGCCSVRVLVIVDGFLVVLRNLVVQSRS